MTSVDADPSGNRAAALRRWLHEIDPERIGILGLLSVPGYLVNSLEFMRVFSLFFLAFFWLWIGPIVDHLLKRRIDEPAEPTDWIWMGDRREWLVAYLSIPLVFVNPLVLLQDLFQMVGSVVAYVRHWGSLPAPSDGRQQTYRLPVSGTWTVVNGSLEKKYSHSWFPTTQRYAYDLVITDADGRTRSEGAAPATADYYCHDEPVLTPADGVVVDALDTDLEPSWAGGFSHPLKRDIRGNYVTIQHAPDEYSCLAHLVPGSVAVEPGERVARGQPVGRVGHSGNSSEPHLHFQFQDHPVFEMAAGRPPLFENVEVESPWLDATVEPEDRTDSRDDATAITAGQRVTATAGNARDRDEKSSLTAGREVVATAERVAFGTSVGSVVAAVVGFFVSPMAAGGVVAGLAVAGFALRFLAGTDRVRRPGGLGVPLGLATVAGIWTVGPAALRSPVVLVVAGLAAYVLVAEFDRHRLRQAFATGADRGSGQRTESDA